jgi:hypothetical protein
MRATRGELATALWTEAESGLYGTATLRASAAQWLAQDEVKNEAKGVGNHNRHNRPKGRTHAAAFRVAVDIAEQQQITTHNQSQEKAQQRPRPHRGSIGLAGEHVMKGKLGDHEGNPCQHPGPDRDDLDFSRHSAVRFVFYKHKIVRFPITMAANVRRRLPDARREPPAARPRPARERCKRS